MQAFFPSGCVQLTADVLLVNYWFVCAVSLSVLQGKSLSPIVGHHPKNLSTMAVLAQDKDKSRFSLGLVLLITKVPSSLLPHPSPQDQLLLFSLTKKITTILSWAHSKNQMTTDECNCFILEKEKRATVCNVNASVIASYEQIQCCFLLHILK